MPPLQFTLDPLTSLLPKEQRAALWPGKQVLVPELTRSATIKLNARLRLLRVRLFLSFVESRNTPANPRAIRGRRLPQSGDPAPPTAQKRKKPACRKVRGWEIFEARY